MLFLAPLFRYENDETIGVVTRLRSYSLQFCVASIMFVVDTNNARCSVSPVLCLKQATVRIDAPEKEDCLKISLLLYIILTSKV